MTVTRGFKRGGVTRGVKTQDQIPAPRFTRGVTRGFKRGVTRSSVVFQRPDGTYDYDRLDAWVQEHTEGRARPCQCGSAGIQGTLQKVALRQKPELCPKCGNFITVAYSAFLLDLLANGGGLYKDFDHKTQQAFVHGEV